MIAILLLAVGGIIYVNFFMGRENLAPSTEDNSKISETGGEQSATGGPGALVRKPKPGLLPYGSTLDLGILKQNKFKTLKSIPELSVLPGELGKQDLFSK